MTDTTHPPVIDPSQNGQRFYTSPETDAITRAQLPTGEEIWVVSAYEDVAAITRDLRFSQTKLGTLTPAERAALPPTVEAMGLMEGKNMLEADQPVHTRLRGLVHKAFTPKLIEAMRPRIQQIADDLFDAVEARGDGQMEFVDEFAFPLPVIVIAELLGLPTEDRRRFRVWTEVLTTVSVQDTAQREELSIIALEFTQYLADLFDQRRAAPRDDLISGLVQAQEQGDKLDEAELHSMVLLLLAAGHETTINLLGNTVLALLQTPEQMARLREQPALITSAVEEFLRFGGPVHFGMRYAREDIAFRDVVFRRGDSVFLQLPAANRDPRRFPNPNQLDVTRTDNKHLSFGLGIHFCLGAPLARLETEIAISTLLRRYPVLALAAEVETQTTNFTFGLRVLPLRYERAGEGAAS